MFEWIWPFRRRTLIEELIQAERHPNTPPEKLQALEQSLLGQYPPPSLPTRPDHDAQRLRAMIAFGSEWEDPAETALLTAEERDELEWIAIPHRWARMRRDQARKGNS